MRYERKHRKELLRRCLKKSKKVREYYNTFKKLNHFSEEEDALKPFNLTISRALRELETRFNFLLNYHALYKRKEQRR